MAELSHKPYKAPDRKGLRKFGLITGLIFIVLFAIIPWLRHRGLHHWPFYPGVFFLTAAALFPRGLKEIHFYWTKLGLALGYVNTRIILMVVYVVVLAPLGLLLRLTRGDALGRRFVRAQKSYRVESATSENQEGQGDSDHETVKQRMQQPY